jgi:mRNA interferase MazF
VGGVARARRVRSRVSTTGGSGSGQPPESEPYRPVVCVPLTSNLVWADAPGNTLVPAKAAGLPKDSVANASQIITIDRTFLADRVGRLPPKQFAQILQGVDVVLGR